MNQIEFPFQPSLFDAVEFYLDNMDSRSQLMAQDNTLERRIKSWIVPDSEYSWIHAGIVGCLELLNTLDDFLKQVKDEADVFELNATLETLLHNEKWNWFSLEKGKKK